MVSANVLEGPNGKGRLTVDHQKFIEEFKKTSNFVLSLGWTTDKSEELNENYTDEHTEAMTKIIEEHQLHTLTKLPLNFDIRAAIAARSQTTLKNFYEKVKKTNLATYTVWSKEDDEVDTNELKNFVKSVGIENVYLVLTDDLRSKLNLGNRASSLIQFGLLNLATLVIVTIFRNGLH